jgi:L-fucose isomerase-like protein
MRTVDQAEAEAVYQWLVARGVKFNLGKDSATELTLEQVIEQCRMYIAAVRIAADFGCDVIGIQYQQGLKDMTCASDLAEGLLNNADRPPVYAEGTKDELYPSGPLVHFNEVDECAGVDALTTNRCWTALGLDPSTTLHDVRWGEHYKGQGIDDFVWLFQISGAAPANHYADGYAGASSERQPAMYFPLGGGSLKGICKPGEIVWSRIFVEGSALHADLGRGTAVSLPLAETERRWRETTPQWPIMHVVLHGVSQNQFMARHRANHVNVAYAPSGATADKALATKAAMLAELGITVHICGKTAIS